MIQGDSLVGNSNASINNQNMDLFDRENEPSTSTGNLYDDCLSPGVEIDPDSALLYAINSSDLLGAGNFDIDHIVNSPDVFKKEESLVEEHNKDVFPDLMEHDTGNLKFNILVNEPENLKKNHWYYSKELQKIFINLNKTFHIDIEHKSVDFELFLRVMMVFIDEISSPVTRCQNHIFAENGIISDSKKFSIIRTENPRAEYCGNENGKNIKDRLSVLIPLSSVVPNDKNMAKQSIALKFVCQNSCVGRKQTAVLFYLENVRGLILSKKVVNIKVCSCPKRDKSAEEQKNVNAKRTAERAQLLEMGPRPGKIFKIKTESSILSPPLSSSSPSNSDDNNSPYNPVKMEYPMQHPFGLGVTLKAVPNGGVTLTLPLPNDRMALEIVKHAYNCIAGEISRNPLNSEWNVYLDELRKLQEK
ncbi:cellular tumor antigen p53 [Condylostylus longicornis]|uniref:cellular tumor antigen p53 n=1 Tax=Condylostylus longicornis TaxID=2530218 RepID=UPI00244E1014|nr:cellular tumor antigen p53 [Condylostylus longicornis]